MSSEKNGLQYIHVLETVLPIQNCVMTVLLSVDGITGEECIVLQFLLMRYITTKLHLLHSAADKNTVTKYF